LRHRIDPGEEDGYGSSWRREWDGGRYHTREHLLAIRATPAPGACEWAAGSDRHRIGHAELRVDAGLHGATCTVGLFVAGLRGRGLGREITRLVLSWAFGELGVHRVELEVLAVNRRAITCYLPCGFRQEGARRDAGPHPDGREDVIVMAVRHAGHAARRAFADNADPGLGVGLGRGGVRFSSPIKTVIVPSARWPASGTFGQLLPDPARHEERRRDRG
jgi:RimJ/RimL family protein N-acetyltransferase